MSISAETLREMLRVGRVAVRVAMPSGDCWALLQSVHGERGGVTVSVTGIALRVPLRDVREATASR
jgi:hypothetical protein